MNINKKNLNCHFAGDVNNIQKGWGCSQDDACHRVGEMRVLCVAISETLAFVKRFDCVCCRAKLSFYALWVLKAHGIKSPKVFDVAKATTVTTVL